MDDIGTQLLKLAKTYIQSKFKANDSQLKRIFYDSTMSFEDLTSELVCYALSKIDKFNPKKSTFATYVYMLYNTKALLLIRYNKRRYLNVVSLDDDIYENTTLLDITPNDVDILNDIDSNEILDFLKDRKSEILTLWLNGMKQKEIALKYNVSQSYISRVIKLEVKKLKEELYEVGFV